MYHYTKVYETLQPYDSIEMANGQLQPKAQRLFKKFVSDFNATHNHQIENLTLHVNSNQFFTVVLSTNQIWSNVAKNEVATALDTTMETDLLPPQLGHEQVKPFESLQLYDKTALVQRVETLHTRAKENTDLYVHSVKTAFDYLPKYVNCYLVPFTFNDAEQFDDKLSKFTHDEFVNHKLRLNYVKFTPQQGYLLLMTFQPAEADELKTIKHQLDIQMMAQGAPFDVTAFKDHHFVELTKGTKASMVNFANQQSIEFEAKAFETVPQIN